MTQVTHSLVCYKVSIAYTSILILPTLQVLTQHLQVVTSTTSVVTKVPHLTTLDYSIVLMYRYKWYAPSQRTPSNQKSDSRLVMVWSPTHLPRVQPKDLVDCFQTRTATIVALQSRTLCKTEVYIFLHSKRPPQRVSFFV